MNPNNDTSETNPTENKTAFVEAATQIKLPQFWTCSPAAWFFQAEAQFNLKRITSDASRYEHVITALPQDIVILVVDILQKPPTENKYETLKKSLLERTVDSEEKRLTQILSNNNELGDRKPSEFYRHLEILAGNSAMVGKELLQNLWMRKLPININVALLASGKQDITELCAIADKIWNVTHTSYISTVSDVYSSNLSSAENYLARLESKIDALEKKFTRTNIPTPPPQKPCTPPCINGGTCSPTERCICPPGYTGKQCETDVDECKQKPCDHICYNTPGSFKCQCKEDFQLQDDGQTCRKENEEASETKDLEAKINLSQKEQEMRMDCISKRLVKLEKMMREQKENGVTKTDLDGIYSNIDKISDDLTAINIKLTQMDCINRELDDFKKSVQCNMGRINSKLGALVANT
ncbi:hypothetical protein Zmor_007903 [Zophobas morio]|uniref:EGF-like domain-containing protein n=1 Tax=Zophobas morio TaxID=2755281 RepID=A0AA38J185_9CUCU|nr:hypothetical protein Zmor_007903 [Zophobas morio]